MIVWVLDACYHCPIPGFLSCSADGLHMHIVKILSVVSFYFRLRLSSHPLFPSVKTCTSGWTRCLFSHVKMVHMARTPLHRPIPHPHGTSVSELQRSLSTGCLALLYNHTYLLDACSFPRISCKPPPWRPQHLYQHRDCFHLPALSPSNL
jgi:hypothetical protein